MYEGSYGPERILARHSTLVEHFQRTALDETLSFVADVVAALFPCALSPRPVEPLQGIAILNFQGRSIMCIRLRYFFTREILTALGFGVYDVEAVKIKIL